MSLFAFFDIASPVIFVLRVAAGLGGALIGWFLFAPMVRLVYYVATRKSIGKGAHGSLRVAGAMLFGWFFFTFAPIGGGGGGLGWGFGPGGGSPGAIGGPGNKGDAVGQKPKDLIGAKQPIKNQREKLDIEIVGGKRYPGGDRFYLRNGEKEPQTLNDIEAYFAEKKNLLEVRIVETADSPGDPGPLDHLRKLLDKNKIPSSVQEATEK